MIRRKFLKYYKFSDGLLLWRLFVALFSDVSVTEAALYGAYRRRFNACMPITTTGHAVILGKCSSLPDQTLPL